MAALPLVRSLARAVAYVFYRVDRAGPALPHGPLILLPNHPNALLDPALVWATAGRDVRFLAKSTLFAGPFGAILRTAGAIPVYRRVDQGVDPSRNTETFAAVGRALAEGEAVCIFPEGVSHSAGRLVPLRTGAARMALGAERSGVAVQLVAVGLNFDRKTTFRSRVTVLFGRPFTAADLASDDEHAAVRRLTERMADEMRRLLVEAEPETEAVLVDRVERLYASARGGAHSGDERVARRQAIARGIERLRTADPARFHDIALRMRRYDARLQRFGLRDAHLDLDVSTSAAVRFVLREGVLAVGLVPLALGGLGVFWIPYRLTASAAGLATRERDVTATAKLFLGAALHAVWIGLLAFLVGREVGVAAALAAAVGLPFIALAGLFAIEREAAVLDTVESWLMLRRARRRSREWLRRERSDLAELLDQAFEWLSAGTSVLAGEQTPR